MGLAASTGRALASLFAIGLPVVVLSWMHHSYVDDLKRNRDGFSETSAEASEILLIALLAVYFPIAVILLIKTLKRFYQRSISS